MDILFVNELLGWFGGAEQYVADTAVGLAARGHRCRLAYLSDEARKPEEYARSFDRVRRVDQFQPGGGFNPECVFIHRVPAIDPIRERLSGRRLVRMVHDHDLCCPRRHKYFAWNLKICDKPAGWRCWLDGAFLVRKPDRSFGLDPIGPKLAEMKRNWSLDGLLVGSRAMARELALNGCPEDKIHLVPPVIPIPEPLPDVDPGPPSPEPRILFVGQLIRGKGVDLLLKALKELKGDWLADIVGVGSAEAGLKAQATELGLTGRVRFTGWAERDEVARRYQAARVVVVPSRWPEPFGLIGLEAANFARPVVAFRVGGIPDWLDHGRTGLLVEPQDWAGLAAALQRLLDDADLAGEMGRRARQETLARFDYGRTLDRLTAILEGQS